MRAPPARGNVQKVKRNLFGSPSKEDQEAFRKTYEETMARDRQVINFLALLNFSYVRYYHLHDDDQIIL